MRHYFGLVAIAVILLSSGSPLSADIRGGTASFEANQQRPGGSSAATPCVAPPSIEKLAVRGPDRPSSVLCDLQFPPAGPLGERDDYEVEISSGIGVPRVQSVFTRSAA